MFLSFQNSALNAFAQSVPLVQSDPLVQNDPLVQSDPLVQNDLECELNKVIARVLSKVAEVKLSKL